MARPDRSDVNLPPEEAAKQAKELADYFDGLAPRRHPKPSRSDYPAAAGAVSDDGEYAIPELDKLHELESNPQKLEYEGGVAAEEFVETEYYKDLDGIEKQHFTTGMGYIKIEKSNGNSLHLSPPSDASGCPVSCKGNPATNEWIPSADAVIPVSHKPNRSEV